MLRPLKVFEDDKNGRPNLAAPLPLNEQRPLTPAELEASGHGPYREAELQQLEDVLILRAERAAYRRAMLTAADATAREKK